MAQGRPVRWMAGGVSLAAAFALVIACNAGSAPAPEQTGTTQSALWTNGGFESSPTGQPPGAPWVVQSFLNNTGITVATPETYADLNLAAGGNALTTVLDCAAGAGACTDATLGATATLRWPRYGNKCAIVNNQGNNKNVNILSQTMTVAPGDVDPSDGQIHVRFTVAPVLQNPAHTAVQQPYYMVIVTDLTKNTILYSDFNLSGAGIPWLTETVGGNVIDYTNWQLVDVSGAGGAIAQNDMVELQVIASGCEPGARWGQIYVDGVGAVIPGINITGTAPAQANAGANFTYTFTYRNGSPQTACTTSANCPVNTEACIGGFCAETGVVIDVPTPANTVYEAITPPAGATCTTPAVGAAGTVVCTFTNPVSSGALGTFTVTVQVAAGTATGTTIPRARTPSSRPRSSSSSARSSTRSSAVPQTRSVPRATGATRA